MKVELHGLQVFGYHGVEAAERRLGQLFLFDVELEVGERGANDRIEDAIDYREVALCVREISQRPHALLEALATSVADTLLERFAPESVRVRVRSVDAPRGRVDLDPAEDLA